MIAMAKITVTVKNIDGKVLSGANVTYGVNGLPVKGVTDDNGIYVANGLPAKSYAVTASINGYVAQTEGVVLSDDDEKSVDFTLAAQNATVSAVEQALTGVVSSVTAKAATATSWDEVYGNAKTAMTDLGAGLDKGVALAELTTLINNAKTMAFTEVDAYESALMIKRHTLPFWQCVGIDFELLAIEAAKLTISIELNKLLATAKAKYSV